MFTGIIEALSVVKSISRNGENLEIGLACPFAKELKVDQSIAHNGVCLTVTEITDDVYFVTAIQETLSRTNLGLLQVGDLVNVERCLSMNGRIDGHLVQGHVDTIAICNHVGVMDGSWIFEFGYEKGAGRITVEKGSICVNGVSLTVVDSNESSFSVAIIPYTFEHTNFNKIVMGSKVNLEFDILGKYVEKILASRGL
ncbi:MAG: riboflavin synthase [Bacteroidota bacterium]